MPVGFSSRCKACNSPLRAEIDRRLLAGESARSVAEWLEREHAVRVGHVGLANHKGSHLNVVAEAKARIEQAAPVFEEGVERILADVSLLDEIASVGIRVARKLESAMNAPTTAQAAAFGHALKEARGAVVDKHELLHGKKLNVEGYVDSESLHADIQKLVSGGRGEADPETDR